MEYYCAERNNELEEFHVIWKDFQVLMQSEKSRTRRTLYTENDNIVVQSNVMDFSTSSNEMIQNNAD